MTRLYLVRCDESRLASTFATTFVTPAKKIDYRKSVASSPPTSSLVIGHQLLERREQLHLARLLLRLRRVPAAPERLPRTRVVTVVVTVVVVDRVPPDAARMIASDDWLVARSRDLSPSGVLAAALAAAFDASPRADRARRSASPS